MARLLVLLKSGERTYSGHQPLGRQDYVAQNPGASAHQAWCLIGMCWWSRAARPYSHWPNHQQAGESLEAT